MNGSLSKPRKQIDNQIIFKFSEQKLDCSINCPNFKNVICFKTERDNYPHKEEGTEIENTGSGGKMHAGDKAEG